MKYEVINEEYRIAVCKKEDLPPWVVSLGKPDDAVFFYHHQCDLIVLNQDHANYEFNLKVTETYLSFDNEQRKEFADLVKDIRVASYVFLRRLDLVSRIRRTLTRKRIRQNAA